MRFQRFRGRAAFAGLAGALAVVALAGFATYVSAGAGGGAGSTTLGVGTVQGPDMPLAWKSTATINSQDVLRFQWSFTDQNVGYAKWYVHKGGTSTQIATGDIKHIPAAGKPSQFTINFGGFIPKTAPASGLKYDVTVATFPKVRLIATTGPRKPPVPLSTSPKVTIAYVRPGKQVMFDDDMGYSRRDIRIELHTLDVGDEDDPLSNDEPYAVMVGFRFRVLVSAAGKASIQPGTLNVWRVGDSCHNNMGYADDDWCDEDDDPYDIRGGNLVVAQSVPTGQVGWVVGAVVVMFEEDAFTRSTAVTMRDKIIEEAKKAIASLNFSNVGTDAISDAVQKKIVGQIKGSFKYLAAGTFSFLSGLAQAMDPDDIAGFNTVIAFTAPGGRLGMTSGQPPATPQDILTKSVPVTGPVSFSLAYPAGDLSKAPGNARYQGQMAIRGTVSTKLVR